MIHIIFSPVSVVNESFDCVIKSWGAIVPMMNGTMICNNFYWGYCYNLPLLIWIMIYKYYYRQLLNGISGSSCKDVAMHFLNHSAYHRMVFIKFFQFTFLLTLSGQYLCYTVFFHNNQMILGNWEGIYHGATPAAAAGSPWFSALEKFPTTTDEKKQW